ncbi:hypothetical protein [Granulosicoccus sp. 3-233]|uniref:hypothetical protein n=1 Tax=Granulosicoccus sp. 3-233 TaxID=3417969 RepID=UPI003D3586C9
MSISVNFNTGRTSAYPSYSVQRSSSAVQQSTASTSQTASREALLGLSRLVNTLEELANHVQFKKSKEAGVTELVSTQDLGLYAGIDTATILRSTDDINSWYTSYSPEEPAWQGITSSDIALHGIYDGSNGSGTVEFRVNQGGFRNLGAIEIEVSLPNGGGTETITTNASDAESTIYTLSNGLGFSLSSGFLAGGDVASTTVTLSTTESINPDNPFNGSGSGGPHFENGHVVTAGTFQVNGATITVAETDSVNSVLAKINASSANVTASFDVDSEIITLTQNSLGSDHEITVGNDTTGFLAATKLASATQVKGLDHEPDRPLSRVNAFDSVQSGTLAVNGSNLTLDVDNDSLNNVLTLLNNAPSELSATLVNASQRVSLSVRGEPYTLSISSGNTGLFPSLNIADGDYEFSKTNTISAASRKRSYRAADELEKFHDGLVNAAVLLRQSAANKTESLEESLLAIQEDYTRRFGAEKLRSVGVEWRELDQGLIDYSEASRRRFTKALQRNDTLEHMLLGRNDTETGLLEEISTTLESFILQQARSGGYGQIINMYA